MISFSVNTVKELLSSAPFSVTAPAPGGASNESITREMTFALFTTTAVFATLYQKYSFASVIGGIYDKMIVKMTEVWYKKVLEKQPDGAIILDVGIGTAGTFVP